MSAPSSSSRTTTPSSYKARVNGLTAANSSSQLPAKSPAPPQTFRTQVGSTRTTGSAKSPATKGDQACGPAMSPTQRTGAAIGSAGPSSRSQNSVRTTSKVTAIESLSSQSSASSSPKLPVQPEPRGPASQIKSPSLTSPPSSSKPLTLANPVKFTNPRAEAGNKPYPIASSSRAPSSSSLPPLSNSSKHTSNSPTVPHPTLPSDSHVQQTNTGSQAPQAASRAAEQSPRLAKASGSTGANGSSSRTTSRDRSASASTSAQPPIASSSHALKRSPSLSLGVSQLENTRAAAVKANTLPAGVGSPLDATPSRSASQSSATSTSAPVHPRAAKRDPKANANIKASAPHSSVANSPSAKAPSQLAPSNSLKTPPALASPPPRPTNPSNSSSPSSSNTRLTKVSDLSVHSHTPTHGSGLRQEIKCSASSTPPKTKLEPTQPPRNVNPRPLLRRAVTRAVSPDESLADGNTSTTSISGGSEYMPTPKLSSRLYRQFPSLHEHLETVRNAPVCRTPPTTVQDLFMALYHFNQICRQYFYQYREVAAQILVLCPHPMGEPICELLALAFYAELVVAEEKQTPRSVAELERYCARIRERAEGIYQTLSDYYSPTATAYKRLLDPDDVTDGGRSMIMDGEEEEDLVPAGKAKPPSGSHPSTLVPSFTSGNEVLGPVFPKAQLDSKMVARALERGNVKEIVSLMIPDPEDIQTRVDEDLWDMILSTYQFVVVKRSEFLPEVMKRFNLLDVNKVTPNGPNASRSEAAVRRDAYQRRILRFLTKWLRTDSCFETSSEETRLEVVEEFIAVEAFSKDRDSHHLEEMFGFMRAQLEERRRKSPKTCGIQMIAPWVSVVKEVHPVGDWKSGTVEAVLKRFRGSHATPKEHSLVARSLTALVASLFEKATAVGLIRFWEWDKKVKGGRADAEKTKLHDECEALFTFLRRLQAFVTHSVLTSAAGSAERACMIGFWLGVASVCLHHNDYSSAGTIFLGVDTVPIRRLSRTIQKVSFSAKGKYHKLSELFGGGSYDSMSYMSRFQEATMETKFFVPFIPMHDFRFKRGEENNFQEKKDVMIQTMRGFECVTITKCPFFLHETFNGWLYSALLSMVPTGTLKEFETLETKFYDISKSLENTPKPLSSEEQVALWRYEAKQQLKFIGVFRRPQELSGMLSSLQRMLLASR